MDDGVAAEDIEGPPSSRKRKHIMHTILLLALILLVSAPVAVWGVINPGYRGLSVSERPVLDVPTFDRIRINTLNGNLAIQVPLFQVPSIGIPVSFLLSYSSDHRNISSPFGLGWNLSYNIRYTTDAAGNVIIVWGDGRQDTFSFNGATFTSPLGVFMTLTEPTPGQLRLTTKHGTVLAFANNTHRKLTAIADPNGNTLTLSHDPNGRLTTVTDASGKMYPLAYNAAGQLATLTDPNAGGRTYTLSYDALDRLTQIIDPLGNAESYAYDGENLLTTITDRRSNQTTVGYTTPLGAPDTRVPQTVTQAGSTVGIAFNPATKTTQINDPNGNSVTYLYDANNRLTTATDGLGQTETFG
jgi:YD repeat-containing protein